MLDPPDRAVTDPDEAFQFQGRDVVLGLSQKVHGLEPLDKRQFRRVKDRPRGQSNLV
jgi:hypothetical protein